MHELISPSMACLGNFFYENTQYIIQNQHFTRTSLQAKEIKHKSLMISATPSFCIPWLARHEQSSMPRYLIGISGHMYATPFFAASTVLLTLGLLRCTVCEYHLTFVRDGCVRPVQDRRSLIQWYLIPEGTLVQKSSVELKSAIDGQSVRHLEFYRRSIGRFDEPPALFRIYRLLI
jgi:hypothetical protein